MLSWGRKNPSLENKNDIVSTQNERNREIDNLASDLEAFKRFVKEELFSHKICVKTLRNSGTDQKSEITDKQNHWIKDKTIKENTTNIRMWAKDDHLQLLTNILKIKQHLQKLHRDLDSKPVPYQENFEAQWNI